MLRKVRTLLLLYVSYWQKTQQKTLKPLSPDSPRCILLQELAPKRVFEMSWAMTWRQKRMHTWGFWANE
jgi:hypothetical protein